MESDYGWRMGILDAQSEACLATDHVHAEIADCEAGGKFIFVAFDAQGL
jgi:hypothetical protein